MPKSRTGTARAWNEPRGGLVVPNVTIEWLQGRTLDQKRKVIAGITDLLVDAADARREAVQVTFINMSKEDWGRGGLLGIDRTDVHP
jgi:4-oxalocrotonate tautomerase